MSHAYIVFVGGQIPKQKWKISEKDTFSFYTGVGDTSIARGEFTIEGLVPTVVLTDIKASDEQYKSF